MCLVYVALVLVIVVGMTNFYVFSMRDCLNQVAIHKFHRVRVCHRSTAPVIGAANFQNLTDCIRFARERRALAFNFSPDSASSKGSYKYDYHVSCQLLGCPENGNMSTLVKDEGYDYYSAFTNLNDTTNATCIKSEGVFVLVKDKKNYTEAIDACQKLGGDLAHVVSESRTNGLSSLVNSSIQEWYKAAYIGLDDIRKEGLFETPLGTPLACFRFRAWGPSHPRSKHKREDCAILDNERCWKVVKCKHKLAYICEIYPNVKGNYDGLMKKPNCTGITHNKERRKCVEQARKYELLQNATRAEKCVLQEEDW